MKRDDEITWGRLGRIEKVFLVLMADLGPALFHGHGQRYQTLAAMAAILMGVVALIKIGRMAMRNLIWRLRNRLIVAYLFIAVVPIVLILALMLVTSYALIGQMAVYLVNRELENRMRTLSFPAETLTRAPARDPQTALVRALPMLRRGFPSFEMLATGEQPLRYPPDSTLAPPPEPWKNASGLITRRDGDTEHLYAWAHSEQAGNEVTILAPITSELLATLVPGIGDITFPGYTRRPAGIARAARHERAGSSASAFSTRYSCPPGSIRRGRCRNCIFVVDTRYSAVLGIVFGQKADWSELAMTFLMTLISVFLLVEMVSLWAGVKLTRAITGAVHELYEGTQHVQRGRLLLSHSGERHRPACRTGRLVQHHDGEPGAADRGGQGERAAGIGTRRSRATCRISSSPRTCRSPRSLELKGVCNPARMVSGDYYDFMALPDDGAGIRHRRRGGQGNLGGAADGHHSIHHADAVERGERQSAGAPLGGEDGGDAESAALRHHLAGKVRHLLFRALRRSPAHAHLHQRGTPGAHAAARQRPANARFHGHGGGRVSGGASTKRRP